MRKAWLNTFLFYLRYSISAGVIGLIWGLRPYSDLLGLKGFIFGFLFGSIIGIISVTCHIIAFSRIKYPKEKYDHLKTHYTREIDVKADYDKVYELLSRGTKSLKRFWLKEGNEQKGELIIITFDWMGSHNCKITIKINKIGQDHIRVIISSVPIPFYSLGTASFRNMMVILELIKKNFEVIS